MKGTLPLKGQQMGGPKLSTALIADRPVGATAASSGTWTASADCYVQILLWGGGGGGAGSGGYNAGGGGGGGAFFMKRVFIRRGQSIAWVCGAGGNGQNDATGYPGPASFGGDSSATLPNGFICRAGGGWAAAYDGDRYKGGPGGECYLGGGELMRTGGKGGDGSPGSTAQPGADGQWGGKGGAMADGIGRAGGGGGGGGWSDNAPGLAGGNGAPSAGGVAQAGLWPGGGGGGSRIESATGAGAAGAVYIIPFKVLG